LEAEGVSFGFSCDLVESGGWFSVFLLVGLKQKEAANQGKMQG
jgi:hypothetical protein